MCLEACSYDSAPSAHYADLCGASCSFGCAFYIGCCANRIRAVRGWSRSSSPDRFAYDQHWPVCKSQFFLKTINKLRGKLNRIKTSGKLSESTHFFSDPKVALCSYDGQSSWNSSGEQIKTPFGVCRIRLFAIQANRETQQLVTKQTNFR